jgi:predicted nucleic acid-binding protein
VSAFFDTNILVYAFLDTAKRARALEIIAGGGAISAQVLNEFTNVARKNRQREWAEIESALTVIGGHFPNVRPLTADTHSVAVALARDHGLAFYDALIVAAALEAGCDVLYSEDMQDGRAFDRLTIRNPFREAAP